MPGPYQNTGVYDQRDAITQSLMNIAAPPPYSPPPQMPQYQPSMGLPQMPPANAPSQGAPVPSMAQPTLPLTAGAQPGMNPIGGLSAPQPQPMSQPQQPAAPLPGG